MLLADYSASPIPAASLKKAGYGGAIRYISPPREAWMRGKPLTNKEVQDFKANGLELAVVWQYLKEDWRRGFKGGVQDAKRAVQVVRSLGGPANSIIYFAVDSNPTLAEWNSVTVNYVKGLRSVVGDRLGLYCNTKCKAWAVQDGYRFFWWKHNWGSDGDLEGCHVHQFEIDRASVGGVTVDRNRTFKANWGQWSMAHKLPNSAKNGASAGSSPGGGGKGPKAGYITALGDVWLRDKPSQVEGSDFKATLGTFIRLIDAAKYRTEVKLERAERKLEEFKRLRGGK